MRRRRLLRLGAVPLLAWLTGAHTPYRQWQVYRRKHLLIGTSRAEPASYPLGRQIASVLAEHLPESRARVTRGPTSRRLASLLTTGQLEVVLLAEADLVALRDGRPPLESFGGAELRALFRFADLWLVARPDFPDRHAFLVTRTLAENAHAFAAAAAVAPTSAPVPVHAGALAYAAGAPPPEPPEPLAADDHLH